MKHSKVFLIAMLGVVSIALLLISPFFLPVVLLVFGALFLVYGKGVKNENRKYTHVPTLSKEREKKYLESGMSTSEIELFRSTVNSTRQQIQQLQENIQMNAKLRAIDLRRDTLKAAKALFKELVNEPTRLNEASHFLYTHLPNIVDLTNKYLEINRHEIKNRETYEKMEESIQIIEQVAGLITQDYHTFVSDDFDELDIELTVAKRSLNRDNYIKEKVR